MEQVGATVRTGVSRKVTDEMSEATTAVEGQAVAALIS